MPARTRNDRLLDDFDDASAWTLAASDDVKATLRSADGEQGRRCASISTSAASRATSAARRALPIEFPARLRVRAAVARRCAAERAAVEARRRQRRQRLVGPQARLRAFRPSGRPCRFRQREIEFAWGPTADRALRRTAADRARDRVGQRRRARAASASIGSTLRELPAAAAAPATEGDRGRRRRPGHEAGNAIDGDAADGWRSPGRSRRGRRLTVDYGVRARVRRARPALARPARAPRATTSLLSDDGERWRDARRVDRGARRVQLHWLPESEARYVRLALERAGARRTSRWPSSSCALRSSRTRSSQQLAKEAPRGRYPRAYRAASSRTGRCVGVDGGRTASLLSEDGALEPVPGVGSLEPFLVDEGELVSWADVHASTRCATATCRCRRCTGAPATRRSTSRRSARARATQSQALARYRVRNLGTRRAPTSTLALARAAVPGRIRRRSSCNTPGGVEPDRWLDWDGAVLASTARRGSGRSSPPSGVSPEPWTAGPVGDWLRETQRARGPHSTTRGLARAALRFRSTLALAASARRRRRIACRWSGDAGDAPRRAARCLASRATARARVAAHWRERLDRVAHHACRPRRSRSSIRCARALAHILSPATAPRLQPGARAYARSWIRDGAMMSPALLRLGHDDGRARLPRCGTRRIQFARRQGAVLRRPRAAPTRCPRTTATASSSSRSPSSGATRATTRAAARAVAARRARGRATWTRCARASARRRTARRIARVLRPACRRRSATRAIRPSRCIRTGTTSGR